MAYTKKQRKAYAKEYYRKNKVRLLAIGRAWNLANKERRAAIAKRCRTTDYLGCSVDFARKHIEKQFKEGMSWANHGLKGWHIDHIKPLALFDFTDEAQMREALHYTNLQPLWWQENLQKHAKYYDLRAI